MIQPVTSNPVAAPPATLPSSQLPPTRLSSDGDQVSYVPGEYDAGLLEGMFLDAPEMSPDDAIALLMSLNAKLSDEAKNAAIEGVEANTQQQEAARAEQQKKLLEAAAEIAKAKEANLIQQIFGWVGVALAVVAAVVTAVATFGAAAPASALAIAGVVAAVVGAVLGGTTQIVSSIPGAMDGMGKEGAEAFMYTMMALQIAAAIVSVGAGAGGAANAANSAGKTGADAAQTAAELGLKAGKIEAAAEKVGKLTQIATGVNEFAEGGAGIANAQFQQQAEYDKADAAEIAAWLKALAAQDENAVEFVRALQEIQDKGWQVVVGIAKEQIALQQSLVQKFQA